MTLQTRMAALLATGFAAVACTTPIPMPFGDEDAETRTVSGNLMLPQDSALPPQADVVVSFRGLDNEVLAEERSRVGTRAAPYPFQLLTPTDRTGTVTGRVEEGEDTTWTTVSVLLEQGPNSAELGPLRLERVEGEFAPAAGIRDGAVPAAGASGAPPLSTPMQPEPEPPRVDRIAAVEPASPAPAAPSGPVRLACGESNITVAEGNGSAEVRVGEIVVDMEAVDAPGGGRRYAVPDDPATYVSLGEGSVEVSFAGAVLNDCARVGEAN